MKRRFGRLVVVGFGGVMLACALVAAQAPMPGPAPAPAPPAPAPPPAPRPSAQVLARTIEGIEPLTEQHRPYLCVEYHFLRTVCALSETERKQIAREAERMFQKLIEQYNQMRLPGQLRQAGAQARALPDPHRLIQEGMARIADEHLSPEQAARYRAELAQRAEDRKRVAIRSLVERLDQELFLSSAQRTRLALILNSQWNESWFPTEYMLLNPERYLFRIPAQYVALLLDENQKRLWEENLPQRITAAAIVAPRTIPDGLLEDKELGEALEARQNAEVRP